MKVTEALTSLPEYCFNNSEEAIRFGMQATRLECINLKKAILIFQTQYARLKKLNGDFDKRKQIAVWQQLCLVALETSGYFTIST